MGTDVWDLIKEEAYKRLDEWSAMKEREMTQAQRFEKKVKEDHRLPNLHDTATWKELGAENIRLAYQPSGNYKIVVVDFKDGSHWSDPAARWV